MEENRSFIKSVLKGLMGAILITFMLLLILSLVMIKFELSQKVYSISFVVITTLSLVLGSILAAKSNGSKGWLTGGVVGILFFIFIFILGGIIGGSFSFGISGLYRLGSCLIVGTVSGMLGINL